MHSAVLAGLCGLLLIPVALSGQEPMTDDQKLWLEDVTPIITRVEGDVFLRLRTNAGRTEFIALFWKVRNPTPDRSENDFQKEYMERVRFADLNFGHDSPKRGSLCKDCQGGAR
jgi:GWxTD domain-containing protein